jgi:hypothetical protein
MGETNTLYKPSIEKRNGKRCLQRQPQLEGWMKWTTYVVCMRKTTLWFKNLLGGAHLGKVDVRERIQLKLILEKEDARMRTGFKITQGGEQWVASVNMVINVPVP